jgi:fibronectin type 3 domain-containing protein
MSLFRRLISIALGRIASPSARKSAAGCGACGRKTGALLVGLLVFLVAGSASAQAYPNEVYLSGGTYRWKINNVEQGSTADLATAITNCMWNGTGAGREIHILVGGSLSSTIGLPPDVRLFGHGNTFAVAHGGYAVHARKVPNIQVHDMTITSATTYVFRISGCDNVVMSGINIDGGFIGMRIESSDSSSPWNFTSYNLTVTNCRFENMNSHGLETYGIDGVAIDNIVARNNGECGVLLNYTRNGTVGTVDAYRCSYGGGYAGLRFANGCFNLTVKYLKAIECGRGFFAVTGAKNIVVDELYIRDCTSHAILLQDSDGVGINSGTYNGVALYHYTSINCWILATDATGVTVSPPTAPLFLSGTVGDDGVSMNWSAVSGATNYLLQRATTSGGPYVTVAYQETTDFVDRNVAGGTTYHYVVRATNAAGPSVVSSEVSLTAVAPTVSVDSGLQLHYPFDGSGAESGGGAAAAITGPQAYPDGLLNQALAFDGAANFATLPVLTSGDYREFSAAAWVWQNSEVGGQRFFDFGGGTDNYMIMNRLGAMLRFDIRRNGSVQTVQTVAPPLNRWVHVAVTFSGNWATLYINGTAEKAVLFAFNPTQISLTQNYLGKSRFSSDPLFNGRLDEVRLYNRGLSKAEVASLVMNAPPLPPYALLAGAFGTKVNLQWTGTVNATTYKVKRATTGGGPYTTIATGLTGTTYSDNNVTMGTTYYYVVTAGNAQGESPASNQATAVVSDLVAHLKFDETSGGTATDFSGNSWNATLVNGSSFGPGFLKNGLNLPNTSAQHATLPAGVVGGLNDFTISAWVKVGAFSNFARIFDFGTGTTSYMMLTPQYTTGANAAKMRFAITTASAGGEQQISSSTALPLNTWAHVAVTLSGNTGRLYLNGAQVGSNAGITLRPSSLGNTTQNYLGRSQWADPYFTGSIDDFRIYARALSAAELTTLATPSAEPPDSLVARADNGGVVLSWPAATAALTYNVKRSLVSGGPYTTIATGVAGTTYTDPGLSNGTAYHYVVSTSNSRGESGNSPESSATPTIERIRLKFNESSGTQAVDSSGRRLDGTAVNSPAWVAGRLNNALQLSSASTQYLNIPAGVFDNVTDYTISAWVRVTSFSNWARIFDFGTGTANYMFLAAQYDGTGRMRFATRSSTVTTEQQITASTALPLNTWAHVAVTLSGTTGRLYLNGTLVGSNTAMSLNPSGLGSLTLGYLGKSMFSGDPYFNGAVDEFRVWGSALSAVQIAELAAPPAAPASVLATPNNQGVSLSWSAVANATGYVVKRALVSGGPYTILAGDHSGTSYPDVGLENGTTYHYVVSALKGGAEGAESVEAAATPQLFPPAAPAGLTASAGDGQVLLSWSASVDATSYAVFRRAEGESEYQTLGSGIAATSFVDGAATNGNTYFYAVAAANSAGGGDYSDEASATPTAPLTALESWRQDHFGASSNGGAGADSADYDGDGLANLLEYALGTDPVAATATPYLAQVSDGVLRIAFDRVADPNLIYTVEGSSDLVEWDVVWSSGGADNTEGIVTVTDDTPVAAATRRFLRLRVSTSAP